MLIATPISRSLPVNMSTATPNVSPPANHSNQPPAAPTTRVVWSGKAPAATARSIIAAPMAKVGRRCPGRR
jgi:hypothetical protein